MPTTSAERVARSGRAGGDAADRCAPAATALPAIRRLLAAMRWSARSCPSHPPAATPARAMVARAMVARAMVARAMGGRMPPSCRAPPRAPCVPLHVVASCVTCSPAQHRPTAHRHVRPREWECTTVANESQASAIALAEPPAAHGMTARRPEGDRPSGNPGVGTAGDACAGSSHAGVAWQSGDAQRRHAPALTRLRRPAACAYERTERPMPRRRRSCQPPEPASATPSRVAGQRRRRIRAARLFPA